MLPAFEDVDKYSAELLLIILNQKPLYYVSMQYIVQKLFIAHFKLKWIEGWRF